MGDIQITVKVRSAQLQDVDDIAAMARALSASDGGRVSRFSATALQRDGFGKNPAFETKVAIINNVVTGYAVYYWGYDTDSATRGVYLADLFVHEHHRRSGVGTALITEIARSSRDAGGRWMFWSVLKRNKTARRFYRRIAPELKDVLVCAAFGASFDRIANTSQ